MAKYIVTGGAGFIGSHITDALITRGDEVTVIDNLATGKKENINPRAFFVEADIKDLGSIRPSFQGMVGVFHCAALPRIQTAILDPLPAHHANITGTLNVLVAARDAKVGRVIYSGSSSVYGTQDSLPFHEAMQPNPLNPYAVQKLAGELYCKNFSDLYGLSTVILRYFNVYGPREILDGAYATVIGIFRSRLSQGLPMTMVADGDTKTRDFTHVSDVVRANLLAMETVRAGKGEIINVGTGAHYTIKELAEMFGGPIQIITPRSGETVVTLADNRKAKDLLGWEPKVLLPEGVRELKRIHGLS